jgi:hypothetical protein
MARPAGGMIVSDRDASGRGRLKLGFRLMAHTRRVFLVGMAADDDARIRAGGGRTRGEQ